MTSTGIVIVSHSKLLAVGLEALLKEVAQDVSMTVVGGLEDGSIGTSFEQVMTAVTENPADQLLAFFDLGSARMMLEMVAEVSDKTIQIQTVPIVEGAYTAAALLQAEASLDAVLEQLAALEIQK